MAQQTLPPTLQVVLDSLHESDPFYVGTLGIKPKSYDSEKMEMTFDASIIVSKTGKVFKRKVWIVVSYNNTTDLFDIEAIRLDKNYNRIVENSKTMVEIGSMWRVIHSMVSF